MKLVGNISLKRGCMSWSLGYGRVLISTADSSNKSDDSLVQHSPWAGSSSSLSYLLTQANSYYSPMRLMIVLSHFGDEETEVQKLEVIYHNTPSIKDLTIIRTLAIWTHLGFSPLPYAAYCSGNQEMWVIDSFMSKQFLELIFIT